jgi:hypothetical protein
VRLSQGSVHSGDAISPRSSPASGKGSRPRRIYVSPEDPLQQRTRLRLARDPVFTKKQPWTSRHACDGTSQVIRPTYSCPCLTDIRHPVDVPKSLDKFGIFPYLSRNVSPVLQTLQNIGDKEMRKRLHKLTFIKK